MNRGRCPHCRLASPACVCRYVDQQDNRYPVLILQHPDESQKPLGTAKLIQLGLAKCLIINQLNLSFEQYRSALAELGMTSALLLHHLYRPEMQRDVQIDLSSTMQELKVAPNGLFFDGLVLVDGTFRNVRELFLVNEWLNDLPRLVMKNTKPSRYRLRKSNVNDALSSIEAVSEILERIDTSFCADRLLKPFEQMIEYQIQRMGRDTFHQNYSS